MARFTAEVFQNEFLDAGATEVHAIVSVTCADAGAVRGSDGAAAEIVIIDCSGSMDGPKMDQARKAAAVALDQIVDGTWFAVIAGAERPARVFPGVGTQMMIQMDAGTRAAAQRNVAALRAGGGTAIGSWLGYAREHFGSVSQATQRHALLLTDGLNGERPGVIADELKRCVGLFQCDARGVGQDWSVAELREVATALSGSIGLIADPAQLVADFEAVMRTAMSRGVADVTLNIWAPQGAQVTLVKQVSPTLEDLTSRRTEVNPLTGAYSTGAWSDESRDYQISVSVVPAPVGQERLAARVSLVVNGEVMSQGLVKAKWSDDETLTARIDPAVAHYTGQAEMAQSIQEGLAAKAAGDEATATARLGRAVQIAQETGDDEATSRLSKLVVIEDPATGTVRLKKDVTVLEEMEIDVASTKTARVKR